MDEMLKEIQARVNQNGELHLTRRETESLIRYLRRLIGLAMTGEEAVLMLKEIQNKTRSVYR